MVLSPEAGKYKFRARKDRIWLSPKTIWFAEQKNSGSRIAGQAWSKGPDFSKLNKRPDQAPVKHGKSLIIRSVADNRTA